MLLGALAIWVCTFFYSRISADDERIRCLREDLEEMRRRQDYLPRLIRSELQFHEERMKEWLSND